MSSFRLESYSTLIFDCDGVLWHENTPVPGAIETLQQLEKLGKNLIFITNNSSKSREQYMHKFVELGFNLSTLSKKTVYCSSYAAAHYCARLNAEQLDKEKDSVLSVGDLGIGLEMREAGVKNVVELRTLLGTKHLSKKELIALKVDPTIRCVVVGIEDQLTYSKVAYASIAINGSTPERPILFLSTNQDSTLPTDGNTLPGGGSCVAMIETATGKKSINLGKPESYMLDLVIEDFQVKKENVLMIGDRLDTDILFGQRGGIDTLLVETGIHKKEDIPSPQKNPFSVSPTYIFESVNSLLL